MASRVVSSFAMARLVLALAASAVAWGASVASVEDVQRARTKKPRDAYRGADQAGVVSLA